jgi:hypothetical protein
MATLLFSSTPLARSSLDTYRSSIPLNLSVELLPEAVKELHDSRPQEIPVDATLLEAARQLRGHGRSPKPLFRSAMP